MLRVLLSVTSIVVYYVYCCLLRVLFSVTCIVVCYEYCYMLLVLVSLACIVCLLRVLFSGSEIDASQTSRAVILHRQRN